MNLQTICRQNTGNTPATGSKSWCSSHWIPDSGSEMDFYRHLFFHFFVFLTTTIASDYISSTPFSWIYLKKRRGGLLFMGGKKWGSLSCWSGHQRWNSIYTCILKASKGSQRMIRIHTVLNHTLDKSHQPLENPLVLVPSSLGLICGAQNHHQHHKPDCISIGTACRFPAPQTYRLLTEYFDT